MDNHVMHYACDNGSLFVRRCHFCTNVILSEQCKCECELGFDCDQEQCYQYSPVGRTGSSQRIDLLLELSKSRDE